MKRNTKSLLFFMLIFPVFIFGQNTLKGKVIEQSTSIPLPGVNVVIKGTTTGTSTDFDGNYQIDVQNGDVIVFTYIGYQAQEITYVGQATLNVQLIEDTSQLDEVVIIGYGATTIKDATGSLDRIDSEEFNRGAIVSPENLLAGKSAGVRITTSSGSPGAGAEIRIRNGGSLSANNSPLIVVDGIPLSGGSLNAINPNEIESYTVLKDASATAIYGSRATAGVVIITTKKGKTKAPLKVEYDIQASFGKIIDKIDVLSASQLRQYVIDNGEDPSFLGNANTDWQDEIYETAEGAIHNLTLTKGFKNGSLRTNYNLSNQNGLLMTSQYRRNAININFEHRFLEDHLKVNVTSKGSLVDNRFANEGAIGSALFFDPTQPVEGNYGGYFEFEDADGVANLAPRNPVSLLELNDNRQRAKRNISNIQLDYKFHFLPELRLNVNAGFDYEEYDGRYFSDGRAGFNNLNSGQFPSLGTYNGINKNRLLDFYLNYKEDFEGSLLSGIDMTAGHTYQRFYNIGDSRNRNTATGAFEVPLAPIPFQLILESYFARANFTLDKKYIFTATYRRDISSRFSKENRNADFPSAAFSWLASDEDFLKDSKVISNLKLRLSWGVTGQQDIGGSFPYLGVYSRGDIRSQYQFGQNFIPTIRPEGYNEDIKWEEATMYNAGIDYGLFDNKISGTLDFYYRKNKDLLQYSQVPGGSNLENFLDQNVGETVSRGIEIGLNATPFKSKDFTWDVSANFTLSDVEITKLTLTDDPNFPGQPLGGISGGVGNTIQINALNAEPGSFYVYKQVVDTNGNPLEGVYVDLNGDNVINDSDKYRFQSGTPDAFFGFTSSMNYKNFDFNFTLRGSLGNYMYNNFRSANGYGQAILNQIGDYYGNGSVDVLNTGFENNQQFSDLYVENASFMKLDNVSLGYTVPFEKVTFRATLIAQNVFTVTNYSGLDPEISGGIDNNIYPKPRTYSLGLNFAF
ncbi:SusC/RagA family TonB-linked outer membrane protein [Sabulilitoribacter multivorans]|uniref:SusC/RagA family TonB-linked outer membrane protein n=1 Tax=Flaviramulus multivorans TaxID=1304750 RepID=A0ABS9ILJ9_9FLAO|nr:SusC/RagA family TonB-linked outer membrane protein [Flaviramulus multivorans]MCF7561466.1 SusC/RagA family TonB-linked outer membrane protein [Flaviramulus multivorans]